ncbi:MAG: peptidoglycan editing factor PgeF [Candidatus Puniceispirillales bacterium WSBS_2018_MAG_OTU23]
MDIPPPFLTDSLLNIPGVRHGFFTRHGGVSTGVYSSLNGGIGSDDGLDAVRANRRHAAAAIGGEDDALCGLYQIHSNICVQANPLSNNRPEGDALVTRDCHVTCLILTADCVPVLFADRHARLIGAAHAGWRGARDGIIPRTVEQLMDMGAKKDTLTAVIGPAIQQASYQVGDDLRREVLSNSPNAEGYFIPDCHYEHHWRFDLPAYVLGQLTALGVIARKMDVDTYSDDRFFSHRRTVHENQGHKNVDSTSGADTGRLMSMIRLTNTTDDR